MNKVLKINESQLRTFEITKEVLKATYDRIEEKNEFWNEHTGIDFDKYGRYELNKNNQIIIISINPLDIFACNGASNLSHDEFCLSNPNGSFYSSKFTFKKETLVALPTNREEDPFTLFQYSSMLTKAIAFIPNEKSYSYNGFKFLGMKESLHMYLLNENQIYCEYFSKYPSFLNNLGK